jgi:hypothetical protein
MTCFDRRGLPMSTGSEAAAAHYRDGVDLMLAAWPGAAERMDAALAEDPDFALACAARARLHAVQAEPAEARIRIAEAGKLAASRGDRRERSHVEILSLAIQGQSAKALEQVLAHAEAWPTDALILSLPLGAFGLFAFSGMADHDQARVDLCARHAASFAEDDWWFLTSQGWARVENGEVEAGRAQLDRAFALRPQNANTTHGLCHALHETGQGEAASALLSDWLPGYDRTGILHGHLVWHGALAALERGDAEGALALYLDAVRPAVSAAVPINLVSDAASFLWRLEAYGHGAQPDLWREAAAYGAARFPGAGHAFVDLHMALIEARSAKRSALEQRIRDLEALLGSGGLAAGPVAPALCRAALAFADGDFDLCARQLEPVVSDVVRIGGSGAQREVVEDMRILALMRAERGEEARSLLERRLARRPSPRDQAWRRQVAG